MDPVFASELANVESGKNVDTAWRDAQNTIERELTREGAI
jgi:cellobiose transport system substrate-binding protein